MAVGERIRCLRKKAGLSQAQLADRLNMSRQAVAKWEKDICEPNLDCLTLMSQLFGVDLDYLITGKTEEEILKRDERVLDKKDIILLIVLITSIVVFMGLFVYSVLNPLYWQQRYSFVWWYIRFWVSSGTWFRILALMSFIGIITSLILFLKRKFKNKKNKR